MGARIKGRLDLATMFGWNAQRFARTKNIKALGEYLKPALSPEDRQATGTAKVRALFERKMRQKKGDG